MRASRFVRSLLAPCSLVAALVSAPGTAHAGGLPNHERRVLSQGHVDAVHVKSHNGKLLVDLKDGTGDEEVLRDPGTVLLHAGDGAKVELPSIDEYPEYAFLGETGQTVWILPEIQIDGVTWPGWNTEDVDPTAFPDQELTWRMLSVRGPGRFHQFVSDAVGTPHLYFDGSKPWPQTNPIINRSHTHANWSFEKEGLYVMRLQIEGRRADGVRVVSDPVEYHFLIGDLSALPADPPAFAVTPHALGAACADGETVTLSASTSPSAVERGISAADDTSVVRWQLRCAGRAPRVLGAGAATFVARAADHGCEVVAVLFEYADDVTPVAEASAGTLHVRGTPVVVPGEEPLTERAPGADPVTPTAPAPGPASTSGMAPGVTPAAPQASPAPRPLTARVTLGKRSTPLRTLARSRTLSARCSLDGPGRCHLRLHVSSAVARDLGVTVRGSARTVTIARGTTTFTASGTKTVRLVTGVRGRSMLRRAGNGLTAQLTTTTDGPGRRWQRILADIRLGAPTA